MYKISVVLIEKIVLIEHFWAHSYYFNSLGISNLKYLFNCQNKSMYTYNNLPKGNSSSPLAPGPGTAHIG